MIDGCDSPVLRILKLSSIGQLSLKLWLVTITLHISMHHGLIGNLQQDLDLSKLSLENLKTPKSKDEYLKKFESYEVTYPVSLQKKKSNNQKVLRRSLEDRRPTHYQIHAFGKTYDINLETQVNFIENGVSVEFYNGNTSSIYQKKVVFDECYRIGRVISGNVTTSAALSDCDGLAGMIETETDTLFIEPFRDEADTNDYKDTHRPHLIYKRKLKEKSDDYERMHAPPLTVPKAAQSGKSLSGKSPIRSKRDAWDSFLTFINKAGRAVQMYWLDLYGKRNYFFTIRPNEKRGINTYDKTRWIAVDDVSPVRLWLNDKKEFTAEYNDETKRSLVFISKPPGTVFTPSKDLNQVIGEEKWIETMLIADHTVTKHHGKARTEKYILTLMNVVSKLLKEKTLGVRLNFIITRLIILEKNEPQLRIYKKDPSRSVISACNFATSLQRGSDSHKDHFDLAIIFTRRDFGPSGYAPVYSMCTRTRSCALVEDDGFTSAFIAAHEVGHTLGLEHDGSSNDCDVDGQRGSVMAPLVVSRFDRFHWSKCSRKTIQENIEYFTCLKDRPYPNDLKYMTSLPGVYNTIDEQCEFTFDVGYAQCSVFANDPCRLLWCSVPSKTFYCKTMRGPALDGSFCGQDKWCFKGRCIASDIPVTLPPPTTITPVDGGWSRWKSWTDCSVSCGVGVRFRIRKCNAPTPANGGKNCQGFDSERQVCNTHPCSVIKSFNHIRNEQCEHHKSKGWTQYHDDHFKTELDTNDKTLNCSFENGLCNWKQEQADEFDWQIRSGRTPSEYTGPANDHTSGKPSGQYMYIEASDTYKERRRLGDTARLFSPVLRVPRTCLRMWYHMYGKAMGSLSVFIKSEDTPEKLLWQQKGNVGNQWQEQLISFEDVVPYQIIIEGVRGRHFTSDAAIDDLSVSIGLCPAEEKAKNPCSLSCRSADSSKFSLQNRVLDGTRCYNTKSFDICLNGKCENFGCDYKFGSKSVYDSCAVCGGDGTSCNEIKGYKKIIPERDYEIIIELNIGTTNFELEDDNQTPYQIGIRDKYNVKSVLVEQKRALNSYGNIGGATFYYETMKDGRQRVTSQGPITDNLEAVLYSEGSTRRTFKREAKIKYKYFEKKPRTVTYKYRIKSYTRCSATCGIGKQTARFQCVKNKWKVIAFKYCTHLPEPTLTRVCNQQPCPKRFKWILFRWRKCNSPCGDGFQSRVVACQRIRGNNAVSNAYCPRPAPTNKRRCHIRSCFTYQWRNSSWAECSQSCDGGIQSRKVTCLERETNKTVADRNCKAKRPFKLRPCHLQACDIFAWQTLAFGKCSKTCGGGLRIRLVYCVNAKTGGKVPNKFCTGPSAPRIAVCNTAKCPTYLWHVGKYGECSATCGNGTRSRDVFCVEEIVGKKDGRQTQDNKCAVAKPNTTIPCTNPSCARYIWKKGRWSGCDALCGYGYQQRSIQCSNDKTNGAVKHSLCQDQKPQNRKSCRLQICADAASFACNFDSSNFCRWANDLNDDFDWKLGGSTPSVGTGPHTDHTTKSGKFAYIEASAPRKPNDKAELISEPINFKRACLKLWYNMRGTTIGNFYVYAKTTSSRKALFRQKGRKGVNWLLAEVDINIKGYEKGYRIIVVAERGRTFSGDIGLDDISLESKRCQPKSRKPTKKPIVKVVSSCREVSPLCVLATNADYCKYWSFRQLCCETCSNTRR